jgi:hypothetical protein
MADVYQAWADGELGNEEPCISAEGLALLVQRQVDRYDLGMLFPKFDRTFYRLARVPPPPEYFKFVEVVRSLLRDLDDEGVIVRWATGELEGNPVDCYRYVMQDE